MSHARNNQKLKTRNSKPKRLVPLLLDWFARNARDLPWRRTRDPYAIWVSEIMLQQTQVKTVIPFWNRWMRELPTIKALANARSEKIHKLWEGLGYYTRVRNLQKAAQQILEQHDGKFPDDFDAILALPGIGRYTAGAICSIAFNQPTPILDGNVIRVLTRIFGIATEPREKQTNARLWEIAEALVANAALKLSRSSRREEAHSEIQNSQSLLTSAAANKNACSHLNQSLMELGALICTPRQPKCPECPVKKLCVASRENRIAQLPNLAKRAPTTERRFAAFIIEHDGKFLVRQRPAGVVNAHLWEFPNVEIKNSISKLPTLAPFQFPKNSQPFCVIKHSITRYRITLEAFVVSGNQAKKISYSDGRWLTWAEMKKLSFPSAHKKILAALAEADRSVKLRGQTTTPTKNKTKGIVYDDTPTSS